MSSYVFSSLCLPLCLFVSSYKDASHIGSRTPLLHLSLHLNYTLKEYISKEGHVYRYHMLETQHIYLGTTTQATTDPFQPICPQVAACSPWYALHESGGSGELSVAGIEHLVAALALAQPGWVGVLGVGSMHSLHSCHHKLLHSWAHCASTEVTNGRGWQGPLFTPFICWPLAFFILGMFTNRCYHVNLKYHAQIILYMLVKIKNFIKEK